MCPVCSKSQKKKGKKKKKQKKKKKKKNEMVEKQQHGINMASAWHPALGYRLRLHGQKVQILEINSTLHRRSTQDGHGQLNAEHFGISAWVPLFNILQLASLARYYADCYWTKQIL